MWLLAAAFTGVGMLLRRSKRTGPNAATASAAQHGDRLTTPVLLLAALGVATTQTIVVAVLPVFSRELGVSATAGAWLLTAFMLASAVATPIAGRLGDSYGHHRVLVVCLIGLLAGSALAGIATESDWYAGVVVGRVLQGLSGGAFPVAFGLARGSVSPERLRGVVAALSAMFGVGGALGMVLAGPLVDVFGTSSLFWATMLIAAFVLAGAARMPRQRPNHEFTGRLDLLGALLLSTALVGLLLVISQGRTWSWGAGATIGCAVVAVTAATLLVVVELRTAVPLIDLRLVCHGPLAAANLATMVISAGMFAAVVLIPQFVQTPTELGYGFAASAARTGLFLVPVAIAMLIGAPLAARISAQTSSRATFLIGSALASAALAALAFAHQQPWQIYLCGALLGIAYGFAFASLGNLVVDSAPPEQTGAATGINTILRTVGGAVGAQLAVMIVANSAAGNHPPTESGYSAAFAVSAMIAGLALVAGAAVRSDRKDSDRPHRISA